MKRIPFGVLALAALAFLPKSGVHSEEEPSAKPKAAKAPATVEEARARAGLLHTAIHGALSVMHRDFFKKGDSRAIPSESLKDVFEGLAEEHGVTVRWLATEETAMNVDNLAGDDWQKKALMAITDGAANVETTEEGRYRFAGAIPLQNQCLKCHVSTRTSLEIRFAALEISMPLRKLAAED
jgi:hypothetical protein